MLRYDLMMLGFLIVIPIAVVVLLWVGLLWPLLILAGAGSILLFLWLTFGADPPGSWMRPDPGDEGPS